ncbi:MAG TPA: 1-deoxy-D-xylulose-5-phosphate synthase [Myxococcaceae bacterium]|nr:1-deoxy-D-xylulose-5-phosphate synthase [Myxococcaceae bacterium]
MSLLEHVLSPKDVRALPAEQLPALCAELRQEIISICGQVGGHLGASLGAVELVVALHRIFHAPEDDLVFDVGHQAYAHKLLTGRASRMHTLRQEGGVAPFLDPRESPFDAFPAGHACTAVSVALGMAQAHARTGAPGRAVAIVGDGALTGGLTFEGLNDAGASGLPLVVVLNDNGMSISANVGAVPRMLAGGGARAFFEALGFTYLGPVNGHALPELLPALAEARRSRRPVLVHVRTEKGRGLAEAEADLATRGHAMGPYEMRDGKLVRSRHGQPTWSDAVAEALGRSMERDERVVVVTPAMLEGSSLTGLARRFGPRVHDAGIAEQHAVTLAAGLAARGLRPVVCIYSTFLQRALDQVIHDVVLPRLPVTFAIDRAGLVGADGATHQGTFDLAFLRPLPGLRIDVPTFAEDVDAVLETALASPGPAAFRFPRGTLPTTPASIRLEPGPVTGARWLRRPEGAVAAIVSAGPLGLSALEAAAALEVPAAVLDVRALAPLDVARVLEACATGHVVTVEEGTVHGGLGSAVLELLAARGLSARVKTLGLPDAPVPHGDARTQRRALGLSPEGIAASVRGLLGTPG